MHMCGWISQPEAACEKRVKVGEKRPLAPWVGAGGGCSPGRSPEWQAAALGRKKKKRLCSLWFWKLTFHDLRQSSVSVLETGAQKSTRSHFLPKPASLLHEKCLAATGPKTWGGVHKPHTGSGMSGRRPQRKAKLLRASSNKGAKPVAARPD